MIHIWHEDNTNSATTQFWNFIKQSGVHRSLIDADIRGFNGNEKLHDYILTYIFNENDTYHIFIDKVTDNQKALKYYIAVKQNVATYENVIVHDLLCFEYLLLRFKYFLEWTRPTGINRSYTECESVRKCFIDCIDNKIPWTRQREIVRFVTKRSNIDTTLPNWQRELQFVSSENIATALLSIMTNGGTIDFGVSKTRLGECWQCNCCTKHKTPVIGKKKCRIYRYHKNARDKARNLLNNTYARNIIKVQ